MTEARKKRRNMAGSTKILATGAAVTATFSIAAGLGGSYQREATKSQALAPTPATGSVEAQPTPAAAPTTTTKTTDSAGAVDAGPPDRGVSNSTAAASTGTQPIPVTSTTVPALQPAVVDVPVPTAPPAPPTTRSV